MELEYSGHSIKGKNHKFNEDSYRLLGNTVPMVKNADCGQIFAVFDGCFLQDNCREPDKVIDI